jgi:cytochrome c553
MFVAILLGLAAALVQGATLTEPVSQKERTVLFPSTRMLNQGREVAESTCADCHGVDGVSMGDGVPQLAGQRAVYLYRVLQAYLDGTRSDQTRGHKGFMNDEAVMAVSAYYSSLAAVRQNEAPDLTVQADMLEGDPFMVIREPLKRCIKCHGETGNGGGSGMPNLTSQHPDYFVTSMMGYLDGSRDHRLMKRLVGNLDEATIQDMGVFYAVQEPTSTENQGEGDVNVGRRLAQACESCHGMDGNAHNAAMPSLAGQDARYFIKAMNQYKDG